MIRRSNPQEKAIKAREDRDSDQMTRGFTMELTWVRTTVPQDHSLFNASTLGSDSRNPGG